MTNHATERISIMTKNDVVEQNSVVVEIHIAAPPERIFQAITRPPRRL
jgi:uncharacterized protein YndB with AHSA1/START domain